MDGGRLSEKEKRLNIRTENTRTSPECHNDKVISHRVGKTKGAFRQGKGVRGGGVGPGGRGRRAATCESKKKENAKTRGKNVRGTQIAEKNHLLTGGSGNAYLSDAFLNRKGKKRLLKCLCLDGIPGVP